MTQHKPFCSTNITCAVYHADGICPGYKSCDCGLEGTKKVTPKQPMTTLEKILADFDKANEPLHISCNSELRDGECDCPVSWNRRCVARSYEVGQHNIAQYIRENIPDKIAEAEDDSYENGWNDMRAHVIGRIKIPPTN